MELQPLTVAISALIDANKILLIKRNDPPFKDLWGLPGGKIRFGEHVDEAAVREIKEETGLEPKFKSIKGFVSEKINDGKKLDTHVLIFICELISNASCVIENEEGLLKWFNLDDIDKYKDTLIPSDFLFIKNFILGEKQIPLHKSVIDKVEGRYIQSYFGE